MIVKWLWQKSSNEDRQGTKLDDRVRELELRLDRLNDLLPELKKPSRPVRKKKGHGTGSLQKPPPKAP